ncbi:GntR family transcriptional regulator [Nibrella saemangeumensis]|uniref:GntR family transcriptional regulator n=1 Tax=Nibrella saemangeumensis TaxID=1084526 RepID=A0ABP8MEM8_9BACT
MRNLIQITSASNRPKYQQIVDEVLVSIEKGTLQQGQQLPSISELADWQGIAKVTVAKAYEALRQRGAILSQHGKGFYVARTDIRSVLNVFVLFDTLNAYKEVLYHSLKEALPADTRLSLFFHHYDVEQFERLIQNSLGLYNYYIIMPHFNEDVSATVRLIPADKLLIIDKAVPTLGGNYASVYQDFRQDIYQSLKAAEPRLQQYKKLTLVLSQDHFQFVPDEITDGFYDFARQAAIPCAVAEQFDTMQIRPGEAYLLFADWDLITCIKAVRAKGWRLGADIGLISYDDTPMKEILENGITVISTDFAQMGRTAGECMLTKATEQIPNPSRIIFRATL